MNKILRFTKRLCGLPAVYLGTAVLVLHYFARQGNGMLLLGLFLIIGGTVGYTLSIRNK